MYRNAQRVGIFSYHYIRFHGMCDQRPDGGHAHRKTMQEGVDIFELSARGRRVEEEGQED
jgi:hypothetical protein